VRELENVLQRATILAEDGRITVGDLPPHITPVLPESGPVGLPWRRNANLRDQVREYEQRLILQMIEDCAGDRRAAAQRLGIGLSSLYRKLEERGLAPAPESAEADSGH
jgi:two-component system, NtrC family, response regulator AtoC